MPSPFPGMDPYLEARWGTFHGLMSTALTSALNQVLPADLEARMEEQVRVQSVAGDDPHRYRPDVSVANLGNVATAGAATATAAVADADQIRIRYVKVPEVLRSILIVDTADGDRLITGVEVLSPSNKRAGQQNRDYRRKLRRFEANGTNWVELDLLRSSRSRLTVRWDAIPLERRSDYLVVTYRAASETLLARPVHLRQPLPVITIPMRLGETDATVDLQQAFTRAFADGSFKSIDYTRPPDPPLSDADAAWAAELLLRPR